MSRKKKAAEPELEFNPWPLPPEPEWTENDWNQLHIIDLQEEIDDAQADGNWKLAGELLQELLDTPQ